MRLDVSALILFVVAAGGCSSLAIYSGSFTSAHDVTLAAMSETSVRIAMYAEKRGHLPRSLKDLPPRAERANRTDDGWNRPLQYKLESDQSITLKSLGDDGKAGGTDAAADIVVHYDFVGGALIERHALNER